jgi:Cu/Ag efflux protein CusF
MRKRFVLSLALVLVFAGALAAVAQTSGSMSSTPSGSTAKYHRVHGSIESVDATAQTFTVKHGNDTSTFKTDASTKFKGAGKAITFADLKAGDEVRVSYTENGTDKTAARVDTGHWKKKSAS